MKPKQWFLTDPAIEDAIVERNLKGIELEKQGFEDKAIELYKQNVALDADCRHPYTRLAVIYHKRKLIDLELGILTKAVNFFPDDVWFKLRLDKRKRDV